MCMRVYFYVLNAFMHIRYLYKTLENLLIFMKYWVGEKSFRHSREPSKQRGLLLRHQETIVNNFRKNFSENNLFECWRHIANSSFLLLRERRTFHLRRGESWKFRIVFRLWAIACLIKGEGNLRSSFEIKSIINNQWLDRQQTAINNTRSRNMMNRCMAQLVIRKTNIASFISTSRFASFFMTESGGVRETEIACLSTLIFHFWDSYFILRILLRRRRR